MNSEILFLIIKLVTGGFISFLAILLMSKNRDSAWMCMVAGFLTSYAALVYEVMISLGVISIPAICLFGIPVSSLICFLVPDLFFIISFILMLIKK